MKITKKTFLQILGGVIILLSISTFIIIQIERSYIPIIDWEGEDVIEGSAASYRINQSVNTDFGTYIPINSEFNPSINPHRIQKGLRNVDMKYVSAPNDLIPRLEKYRFALKNEGETSLYDLYNYDYHTYPKFITTDLALHTFSSILEDALKEIELGKLFCTFQNLLITLLEDQLDRKEIESDITLQNLYLLNIAYLSVMLKIMDTNFSIPSSVETEVQQELENINSTEMTLSPIFNYLEDYSQYIVRSYYTENENLSRYFKAMMYAGRISFEIDNITHTQAALLLLPSFSANYLDHTGWEYWIQLNELLCFFVGNSDDLTIEEYKVVWDQFGTPINEDLLDITLIQEIQNALHDLKDPEIQSNYFSSPGMRMFGQRAFPDSIILKTVSDISTRLLPSSLDLFSVLGCPRALQQIDNYFNESEKYNETCQKLRIEYGNFTDNDWVGSVYNTWLYSLLPLLEPAKEGYPGFMRNDEWSDKALLTTSGSWTELRHNFLLYGDMPVTTGYFPYIIKGYVEPYPELYGRLESLCQLLSDVLNSHDVGYSVCFDDLKAAFEDLRLLSIKELNNEELNQTDYSKIDRMGRRLAWIKKDYYIAKYQDNKTLYYELGPFESTYNPVIADIYSYINGISLSLEIAIGDLYTIYVIVQDSKGNLRLCKGYTYSYYEFSQPLSDRLTDEAWQERLHTNPPNIPEWINNSFF